MDHHAILGNSLSKITLEKAGAIINDKQHCISCFQKAIVTKNLKQQANKHGNKITFVNTHNTATNKSIKLKHLKLNILRNGIIKLEKF